MNTTSRRRKAKSFPIPNLRDASQIARTFKQPAQPAIVVLRRADTPKSLKPTETSDCAEYRRQRVEAITRQCPRVIVTSKWTWEAPIGG